MRGQRLVLAVHVAEASRDQILAEAEHHLPCETGGLLLGVRDGAAETLVITELMSAGPGAQRERYRFVPDGAWQRRQIAERYEASGRTLEYLGDWHSHPHGNGPSRLDRNTARSIARTRSARCAHPLFLIASREREEWELRAYRFGRRRFRRMPVVIV